MIFEGNFTAGSCDSIGKMLYSNGDIYFGTQKGFIKDGQGKLIMANGSSYEGGWANDRKFGNGLLRDAVCGDVYNGAFSEGKRNGRGRQYYHGKNEIYDGEWANDKRSGEGFVITRKGVVSSGEFRADNMEGKLTYQKTLPAQEADKIFKVMTNTNDMFIVVNRKSKLA